MPTPIPSRKLTSRGIKVCTKRLRAGRGNGLGDSPSREGAQMFGILRAQRCSERGDLDVAWDFEGRGMSFPPSDLNPWGLTRRLSRVRGSRRCSITLFAPRHHVLTDPRCSAQVQFCIFLKGHVFPFRTASQLIISVFNEFRADPNTQGVLARVPIQTCEFYRFRQPVLIQDKDRTIQACSDESNWEKVNVDFRSRVSKLAEPQYLKETYVCLIIQLPAKLNFWIFIKNDITFVETSRQLIGPLFSDHETSAISTRVPIKTCELYRFKQPVLIQNKDQAIQECSDQSNWEKVDAASRVSELAESEYPNDTRVCLVIQLPERTEKAIASLQQHHTNLFGALQVKVQKVGLWSEEDVTNNLKGGSYLATGRHRSTRLAKVERELERKRTYKEGVFAKDDLRIATASHRTEFEEVFEQTDAQSSVVKDNNELI
ncbi:hypothetical protein PAXINDRAFT_182903, partial [Paxillus involutus ATCC 200175]